MRWVNGRREKETAAAAVIALSASEANGPRRDGEGKQAGVAFSRQGARGAAICSDCLSQILVSFETNPGKS